MAFLGSFRKLFGSKGGDERSEIEAKLKSSPNDPQLHQRLGLVLVKQREVVEGIAELARAAELYEKDGFANRAIAVLRQLLRSDPHNLAMQQRLIALLASQGLSSDALAEFERSAKDTVPKLPEEQQVEFFSRVAEVLPASPEPHLHAVDSLLRGHKLFEAVSALEKALPASVGGGAPGPFLGRLKAIVSAAGGQPEHLEPCGFLACRIGDRELGMTLFKQVRAAALSEGEADRLAVIDRVMAAIAVGWDVGTTSAMNFEEAAGKIDEAPPAPAPREEPQRAEPAPRTEEPRAEPDAGREPASEEDDGMVLEALGRLQAKVDEEIGDSDLETRYNLGIAYKEMGLYDEAVAEFRIAARRADLRIGAITLLADVLADRGDVESAVLELDGLVGSGILDASSIRDVRYHKAILLERSGREDAAAAIYRGISEELPGYRDVQARLERFGG